MIHEYGSPFQVLIISPISTVYVLSSLQHVQYHRKFAFPPRSMDCTPAAYMHRSPDPHSSVALSPCLHLRVDLLEDFGVLILRCFASYEGTSVKCSHQYKAHIPDISFFLKYMVDQRNLKFGEN